MLCEVCEERESVMWVHWPTQLVRGILDDRISLCDDCYSIGAHNAVKEAREMSDKIKEAFALREARARMSDEGGYRTKTGHVLTDAEIEALADEAEQGYDIEHLRRR